MQVLELSCRALVDLVVNKLSNVLQVKAFTYGSVPLKTYLPDGDIDLAIFQSKPQALSLRDTWFNHLANYLKREAYNFAAPYRIRDVQVIHAEVRYKPPASHHLSPQISLPFADFCRGCL